MNKSGENPVIDSLTGGFEQTSQRYVAANGIERDADWFILKLQEELGELTQIWNSLSGRARRRGRSDADLRQALADETADLLGHVMLFARHNDIDLTAAVARKWRFEPQPATTEIADGKDKRP